MKRYRLYISTITILLVVIAMLSGCGKEKVQSITKESAIKLSSDLLESGKFDSKLSEVNLDVAANLYKINSDKIKVLQAYMGDGASAEEIVVLEGDYESIKKLVETYLDEKEDTYSSYLPLEAEKINNAVCKQFGNYTIVCISADSESAEKILSNK